MREVHTFTDAPAAQRFTDVLIARSMPAVVEEESGQWVVWIQNDDHRESAKQLLQQYLANPGAEEFQAAARQAKERLREEEKAEKARRKNLVNIQDRWKGVWWKSYPATVIMVAISVAVVALCTDWRSKEQRMWGLPRTCNRDDSVLLEKMFIRKPLVQLPMGERTLRWYGAADAIGTLKSGEVWRFVTPIFLHFNFLHILFNMSWLRSLGGAIEYVRGTRRFLILVTVIAVISNLAQLYWSGPAFGGMSGVVYGLIGYAWMKGKTQPWLGIGLSSDQVVYSVLFLLLCMGGAFGPIANAAHVAGFVVGIVIGARQAIWKRVVKP